MCSLGDGGEGARLLDGEKGCELNCPCDDEEIDYPNRPSAMANRGGMRRVDCRSHEVVHWCASERVAGDNILRMS